MRLAIQCLCLCQLAWVVTSQDYDFARAEINKVIDVDLGVIAPALIRLAWHSAATYSAHEVPHGGANGATMRFDPEASYEDNRGLDIAIDSLKVVKALNPEISYSDLWVLASYVALERLEGPVIEFKGGRVDAADGSSCPPENRLPEWDESVTEVQEIFYRMGLDDRDLVALMGAHSVGHTYPENSGFPYMQWDNSPNRFDNTYYRFLIDFGWQLDGEGDREFYYNRSWIMLLTDFMIRTQPVLRSVAEEYAADQAIWHKDFARAFKTLTELGMNDGCPKFREPVTTLRGSCPFAGKKSKRAPKGKGKPAGLPVGHPPVTSVV
jgi:catalase (peroxidase I)